MKRRCPCGHVPARRPKVPAAAQRWQDNPTCLALLMLRRPELADLATPGTRLVAGIGENA